MEQLNVQLVSTVKTDLMKTVQLVLFVTNKVRWNQYLVHLRNIRMKQGNPIVICVQLARSVFIKAKMNPSNADQVTHVSLKEVHFLLNYVPLVHSVQIQLQLIKVTQQCNQISDPIYVTLQLIAFKEYTHPLSTVIIPKQLNNVKLVLSVKMERKIQMETGNASKVTIVQQTQLIQLKHHQVSIHKVQVTKTKKLVELVLTKMNGVSQLVKSAQSAINVQIFR